MHYALCFFFSRRTRKRTANMAGLSTKHNQLQKSTNQLGSCDSHNKQMGTNETNIKESSADKLVQPLDIKLNPNTIPSQDEFIDLISPDPHIVVDEEESTNLLEPSSSRSSINECVNKLGKRFLFGDIYILLIYLSLSSSLLMFSCFFSILWLIISSLTLFNRSLCCCVFHFKILSIVQQVMIISLDLHRSYVLSPHICSPLRFQSFQS